MKQEEEQERRKEGFLRDFFANSELYTFGIITQKGYQALEDKIHRWTIKGLIAVGVVGFFCTLSLIGFGILLTKQGNVTNNIQQQRYDSFLDLCVDQNVRHDKVVAQVDKEVAKTPPPPSRQLRAKQSAKPFKLILEAAVPYTKDCPALARQRVRGQ